MWWWWCGEREMTGRLINRQQHGRQIWFGHGKKTHDCACLPTSVTDQREAGNTDSNVPGNRTNVKPHTGDSGVTFQLVLK